MPRDLSGNMTLVAGNPVTSGTAASSVVQNATMADLAAEIQDSLSRSGKGGMSAPFKNADGTEGAPGITFTNETTTGWYRFGAGEIRMAILGAWKFAWKAAGFIVKGALGLMDPAGTNKTVTLAPPTGLAADYTLTMPTALPGSTLPVTMTNAGVLSTGQLVNAQQNFGTPSAATDVVVLSYLATAAGTLTSIAANLTTNGLALANRAALKLAWFTAGTNPVTVGGAITGCSAGGDPTGATKLFTIPSGFIPAPAAASGAATLMITWYDASVSYGRVGWLVIKSNGDTYFWANDNAGAKIDLALNDQLYIGQGTPLWVTA